MIVDDKWLKAHADEIRKVDWIDPALYQKYNVKRGLRNGDGTGVLVGLTTIGNVHGYVVSEGEKQAAIKLSDRHFGIGGDGIIIIKKAQEHRTSYHRISKQRLSW